MTNQFLRLRAAVVLALTLIAGSSLAQEKKPPKVTYADDVLPILRQKCFSCHNADKKSGDLDLTNYTIFVVAMQDSAEYDVLLVKGGLPTSTAWNYLLSVFDNGFQAGANAQGKVPRGNADSTASAGLPISGS